MSVCYNFTPFLSQVTSYLLGAQIAFPGSFTAFGGACIFVGCTLLSMNYKDQQDLAHVPLVGTVDNDSLEMTSETIKPPIEPDYAQPSEP